MKTISRLIVLLIFSIPAVAAAGEDAPIRQGFGISFGVGGGSSAVECSGCTFDRQGGGGGYLRLGGYVRPNLLVAFETEMQFASSDGIDYGTGVFAGAVQWYPNQRLGFYLKGNLGIGAWVADDGVDDASVGAVTIGLGLGYDIRISRNFSFTPFLSMMFSGKNDLRLNDVSTGTRASFNMVQLGLGFTFY